MVKDPICGMYVNEETAKYKSEYEGKQYYFCKAMFKQRFDEIQEEGLSNRFLDARMFVAPK